MNAYGVPRRSVLEPLLFLMYAADIMCIVNGNQLMCQCYADCTHAHFCMIYNKLSIVKGMVGDCINHIHHRLVDNQLGFKPGKTVVMS